jgi:putative serine protease PepD
MVRARPIRFLSLLAAAAALAGCGAGTGVETRTATTGDAAAASTAGAAPSPVASALAYQRAVVAVVKRVSPSVVQISTQEGLGSGVVFDAKGDIVTNAHVVGGATTFSVTTRSGKQLKGSLVGTFVPDDIAVIRVSGAKLRPAVFADSAKLEVGDIAIAIGNPLGLQSSVTDGIVSALNRTVSEPNGYTLPPTIIQTSAPINPGNSGGALVDIQGRVIGIPTLAATDPQLGTSAPGIGFAIPSNLVKDIAAQLIAHGQVVNSHRAYLGVRIGDTGGQGVYVGQVDPGTAAAKAGLVAGDIIVSVAGTSTPTTTALGVVLARLKPGQTVKVVVQTQTGSRKTLQVTLGQYPGGG